MRSGMFVFTAIERIVFGQPAAQALRAEAERLQANRVFLIVSGTMNRTTDEVAKVRQATRVSCTRSGCSVGASRKSSGIRTTSKRASIASSQSGSR